MTVKVRIAPLERWKDKHPNCVGVVAPGKLVEIDPASMWWDYSDHPQPPFRSWHLVGESLTFFRQLDPAANSICEHMLEMD